MKSKSKVKEREKTKEPFPSDKTPNPPQVVNPSEAPDKNSFGSSQNNNQVKLVRRSLNE